MIDVAATVVADSSSNLLGHRVEIPDEIDSALQLFTDNIPIDQFANETLEGIKDEIDPGDYEAAYERGSTRSYERLVKDVLDGLGE